MPIFPYDDEQTDLWKSIKGDVIAALALYALVFLVYIILP